MPAPVQPVPDGPPTDLLDPRRSEDRPLIAAMARSRAAARARLEQLVTTAVTERWTGPARAPEPLRIALPATTLAALDLAGAVSRSWQTGPAVLDGDDPASARTTWATRGVDRDRLPRPPTVQRRPGRTGWWIDPARVDQELAEGRSFKVRGLDLDDPRLGALAHDVEAVAGTRTNLLAYLAGPAAEGWGVHYDRHDGLVVQAGGRKRWKLWAPVEARPLRPWSPYAVGTPWGEVVLGPGDALFVPRGWGHRVSGVGESSLHLTVPVVRPTGASILRHGARGADRVASLRRDVAIGTDLDGGAVGSLWPPEVVRRALSSWRAAIPSRAVRPGASDPIPAGVRLCAPGGVHRSGRGLVVAGVEVPDDDPWREALAALLDGEVHPVTGLPGAPVDRLWRAGLLAPGSP